MLLNRIVPGAAAGQTPSLDPGTIEKFLSELPEKALNMGLRIVLALVVFLLGVQVIKLIRRIVKSPWPGARWMWASSSLPIPFLRQCCISC